MQSKCLAVGIILMIVGTLGISAIATVSPPSNTLFSAKNKVRVPHTDFYRGETELSYYLEENLDQAIGIPGGPPPIIWQTAIRLTQDEMGTYSESVMTKVNVAFYGETGQSEIDVRIYVYDKGAMSTKPGSIIVNDTTAHLDTTGVTTVPLVTPVNLTDHEELWVAVEWTQSELGPGLYYAWIDTLSGPHLPDKSDFVKLGSSWSQLHNILPEVDGRWGIGAIVEGGGLTELSIGNIRGPLGITADVSNIGGVDVAQNVHWTITVAGGLFHWVTVLENGTIPSLPVDSSVTITTGIFFGFGKILILATAEAQNAPEILMSKTGFLLGPYVIRIR